MPSSLHMSKNDSDNIYILISLFHFFYTVLSFCIIQILWIYIEPI